MLTKIVAALSLLATGLVLAPPAADAAAAAGRPCTIRGTAGPDVLRGTSGADVICGLGGDDVLKGRGGNDLLVGDAGDDVLAGGGGKDSMKGGGGDDRLSGGTGDDKLDGGSGKDRLDARDGATFRDRVRCGSGADEALADLNDSVRPGCERLTQPDPPTDIALSPSTLPENQPAGTVLGQLTAVDPDVGDTHQLSLVPGAGSADNGSFAIGGSALRTTAALDFETRPLLSIRVRATDSAGLTFEKSLAVTVSDVPEIGPLAVDDGYTTSEDTTLDLPVTGAGSPAANDTHPAGAALTVSAVSAATGGTVSISSATVHFVPASNLCGAAAGGFDYTVSDGAGGTDVGHVTVDLTCVPDDPTAVNDAATVVEDSGTNGVVVLANDTDPDGGAKGIASATQPTNGTVAVTGGGTGLTYAPNANYCNNPPGTTLDTFTYTLNGGSQATVSVTVTCVNDAPVADDETLTGVDAAVGNTSLVANAPGDGPQTLAGPKKSIAGDILLGDTDVDGPTPLTVTPGTVSSNDGGTVVIESDGDFTFTPAAGTSCSDTADFFDYTVTDGSTPSPATDVGRVNVSIAGCVWYVHNNAPGNAGTSSAPFDTLAQAETASAAGHTIYLYDGDNSTTGYAAGIDLKANQRLIGELADLVVAGTTLASGVAGSRPTITDTNADVVGLAAGNTVRGVQLDPQGSGGGIAGGAGDAAGTIDDVRIIDTGAAGTRPGLELDGTSGTFDVSNLTVDNSVATGATSGSVGVRLNNAGTVNLASTGTISVTTTGAKGLDATGTNMGAGSVFDDITVAGSGTGAVSLVNTTGTTTLGNGAGTDLDLTTTSGAVAALSISSGGTVSVPPGGSANLSATGGPAADITGTSGATFDLDTVSSTNSANDGVNLAGLGAGTFTATGGAIGGAAGIAFDLDGGSGTVTYPGTLNNGSGATADITNRSGSAVTLGGAVNDTNDAGGGITLAGNTGGSTTFSGATKTINTGAGDAVAMTSSDGHTLTLGGGGLDIDTTSGRGLRADTSGSITVTGTGNTIDTTSGVALDVTNTDIGDNDLTFQHVASTGATSGIVLNTTSNANGRLEVTGNGGSCTTATPTCTGGSISSSTGPGLSLTSVPGGVGLTRVRVDAGGDDGIRATTVNDVDLTDSLVLNNGNNHTGGLEERGLEFLNVTGTPQLLRTTVSGSDDSNAHIQNTVAGTTTLTVDQSTFSDSKFNAGLRLRGEGPSVMNATVTNSVFALNADPGFSMQTDAANTAQQTLKLDNNDLSGGSTNAVSARPQVSLNAGGGAIVKATVTNNDIKSAAGAEVILNTLPSHTGTFDATVTGNDIGDAQPGALDALSDSGTSIWGWAHGDGITRMEIRNNTVQNWGGRALELSLNDGNGDADYTVTGNTFSNPDVSANTFEGVYIVSGGAGGDATDVCVDLENNDMDGIGRQGVSDIALDRYGTNLLRFADYNGTTVPALQANLRTKNAASPALTVETYSVGPTATAATACTLPVGTP